MRLCEGKASLMVFDFVDNASQYNMPYSLHRLFKLNEYRPGRLALAPQAQHKAEDDLYAKGEKPEAIVDYPVDATDYELVDLFNWQEEAAGMLSQMEFVRRVNVQSETVERYIRDGLIVPDLIVPMSDHRTFKYFKEETLTAAAKQYGWTLIDDSNRKALFMDMIRKMDMSYSYKPVLMLAVLEHADRNGRIKISDLVAYFRAFYAARRATGLTVEKANSLYCRSDCTDKEIERNILSNPFKRFEDMQMMRHTKTLGIVEVDSAVWKKLTDAEKAEIRQAKVNMQPPGNETGDKAHGRAHGQQKSQIGEQRGRLQKQHGQQHLRQIMHCAACHSKAEEADAGDFSKAHHQPQAAKAPGQSVKHGKGTAEKQAAQQHFARQQGQRHAAAQPIQREHQHAVGKPQLYARHSRQGDQAFHIAQHQHHGQKQRAQCQPLRAFHGATSSLVVSSFSKTSSSTSLWGRQMIRLPSGREAAFSAVTVP